MILLSEFIDLVKLDPVQVITTLVTVYVGVAWIVKQVRKIRSGYFSKLKDYHNKENEKEHKEDEEEHRFIEIENKLSNDYDRLQKVESHLFEICDQIKDINVKLDELSDMVIDTRLEGMRGRVLDFAPLAIDLNSLQSKEKYTEIFKVHSDYMKLIKATGKENNYETCNFGLIENSYKQRSIKKLFTEDYYIDQRIPNTKPVEYIDAEQKDGNHYTN